MAKIEIEVKEYPIDDEDLVTYTFHINSDDKQLWGAGELNLRGHTSALVGKEQYLKDMLQRLVDDFYVNIP